MLAKRVSGLESRAERSGAPERTSEPTAARFADRPADRPFGRERPTAPAQPGAAGDLGPVAEKLAALILGKLADVERKILGRLDSIFVQIGDDQLP